MISSNHQQLKSGSDPNIYNNILHYINPNIINNSYYDYDFFNLSYDLDYNLQNNSHLLRYFYYNNNNSSKINRYNNAISYIPSNIVILIFTLIYGVIFIVGTTGNFLVIYVVLRNKSMHTITNIFITNLAFSDILMGLLAVPFTPLSIFMDEWKFGHFLCHLVPMTSCVSVHVSTLTSTAIAIDRFFVIVHPFKPRMNVKVCLILTGAIWVTSLSISMPLGVYQRVDVNKYDNNSYCQERWPQDTARQFFTLTSLVLQYIVPCAVITYCYLKVSLCLKARCKNKIGQGRTKSRDEMELKKNRKTTKMLIAMVAIFVCCWLPLNVYLVTTDLEIIIISYYYNLIFLIVHSFAMISTVYNPFLYGWMNENFKKEFATVLPACLFRQNKFPKTKKSGKPTHDNKSKEFSTVKKSSFVCKTDEKRLGPSMRDASFNEVVSPATHPVENIQMTLLPDCKE